MEHPFMGMINTEKRQLLDNLTYWLCAPSVCPSLILRRESGWSLKWSRLEALLSGLRKIHLKSEEKMVLLQNDAVPVFCYNFYSEWIKRQVKGKWNGYQNQGLDGSFIII